MGRRTPQTETHDIPVEDDVRMVELLDEIERETTPERLLNLARQLQEKLFQRRQRDRPN